MKTKAESRTHLIEVSLSDNMNDNQDKDEKIEMKKYEIQIYSPSSGQIKKEICFYLSIKT